MSDTFVLAWHEAEREQILEACQAMDLGRWLTDFVVGHHRRKPDGLGIILAMRGDVFEYVRQVVELLPPSGWNPTRQLR